MAREVCAVVSQTAIDDDPIPEPGEHVDEASGKLQLRLPKSLHRQIARLAEREGVSINTLLVTAAAKEVGRSESKASPALANGTLTSSGAHLERPTNEASQPTTTRLRQLYQLYHVTVHGPYLLGDANWAHGWVIRDTRTDTDMDVIPYDGRGTKERALARMREVLANSGLSQSEQVSFAEVAGRRVNALGRAR
jgi:hypothetical protein